jgi:hypothetical protein
MPAGGRIMAYGLLAELDKTGTELRRVLKEILDPAEENFSENREDESNAGFERYPGNGKWPMFERRD